MRISDTKIPGVRVIESTAHTDSRGSFSRAFCERELDEALAGRHIVQINLSQTIARGALRGLHYQRPPYAEMKIVRCLRGRIWDVALDLRHGSPTFMQWHAEELSPGNKKALLIPEGCAHGFQTLEDDCEMLYLHTEFYQPDHEGGIHYQDKRHNISWPLPVTDISARDTGYPMLAADFKGIQS